MRSAIIFIAFVLGIAALFLAQAILIPIIGGALLALLIAPSAAFIERGIPSAPLSALLASLGWYGGLLAISAMIVTQSPNFTGQIENFGPRLEVKLKALERDVRGTVRKYLRPFPLGDRGLESTKGAASATDSGVVAVIDSARTTSGPGPVAVIVTSGIKLVVPPLGNALMHLFLILLLSTIFLMFRHGIMERLIVLVGPEKQVEVTAEVNECCSKLGWAFFTLACVNAVFGLLIGVLFYAIGVPMPFWFGLILAVLRFVPFIGVPLGTLAITLILFVVGADWTTYILPALIIFIVDLSVSNLLEPIAYARTCDIHPVVVILSAFIWAWLWGPIGFVLSMPLTTALVVLGSSMPSLAPYLALVSNHCSIESARTTNSSIILPPNTESDLTAI